MPTVLCLDDFTRGLADAALVLRDSPICIRLVAI
jgi:hypothetical protein